MDHNTQNSSDDEYVDAQSSINNNFINNNSPEHVLLSPSPSSSSTSSVFSPGSIQTNVNNNGQIPNADEELTPELIQQGWRKCNFNFFIMKFNNY